MVIAHRRKGGVSKTRIGEILCLDAAPHLEELRRRELVYTAPGKELNWWRPTPEALLALGLRSASEIPVLKELERWFDSHQSRFPTHLQAKVEPILEKAQACGTRKRRRELERRASALGREEDLG